MWLFIFSDRDSFDKAIKRLNHSDVSSWLHSSAPSLRIIMYTADEKEFLVQQLALLGVPETSYQVHKI